MHHLVHPALVLLFALGAAIVGYRLIADFITAASMGFTP